jgi:Outer membrane protein beta-barrel domain
MRIRSVLLGTAFLLTTATSAAAQGASSPRAFVGGLGGLTFGTATSSAIAGQVGVRISRDLFVIGEVGRMWDVTPSEVADQIETGIDFLEESGFQVDLDFSVPAFYSFGGVRWAQSGRRVNPFVEGGVGFARLTGEVSGTIGGVDVDDFLEDFGAELGDLSRNEVLIAFGGGANISLTPNVSVDAGYRYTHIFVEDPSVNTSMVYAAVKIHFGR